jgi:putative ABC transport system permease protein
VIGLLGGGVGVLLAALGLRALVGLAPADLPRLETVELDSRVLVFAATLSLLAAFLSGLIPALRSSRFESVAALRSGDRSASSGPRGTRFRGVLVVGEVAIALALLIGAGLLGRSFLRLLESDLGFETKNRAAVQAFIWDRNPSAAQRLQRAGEIVGRMTALPGVEKVAIAASVPFLPSAVYAPTPIRIEGRPQPPSGQQLRAKPNMVSPSYFEILSIPLLAGRLFDATDREDARLVALISESLAKRHFPDENPIGEMVSFEDGARREIVGVVADIRHRSLDSELEPEIYVPFAQSAWGSLVFLATTEVDVRSLLPRLREVIWEVDPGQAIPVSSTLDDLVGETLVARRFNLLLLGAFAVMALGLAAIGIYGLISFSTSRRTHEIGIRMALGSRRQDVLVMILGQGLRLGVLGVVLGIGLALLLTGLLESLLYGVRSTDIWTYVALAAFMLVLTVLATCLPALRAARLDPVKALREE